MAEPDYLSIVMTRDYPRTIALADGGEVVVRPLQAADEAALLAYFHGIPADERLRVFRENVVDPVVVAAWCREIDPRRVLSLVAVEGAPSSPTPRCTVIFGSSSRTWVSCACRWRLGTGIGASAGA